jgi:hypothetical protein
MVVLLLHSDGRTAQQLATDLYGEAAKPVTARAEVSRLRRELGSVLAADPYRLTRTIRADFFEVERLVRAGDVAQALERYDGPLLPTSEVPKVVEIRERIDYAIRDAVLASGSPDLLERWLETASGHEDAAACKALAALVSEADPRRASALSRLRRITVEAGR